MVSEEKIVRQGRMSVRTLTTVGILIMPVYVEGVDRVCFLDPLVSVLEEKLRQVCASLLYRRLYVVPVLKGRNVGGRITWNQRRASQVYNV